jgi:hypothetical protein
METRNTARLFEGAHVTIGNVKNPGRDVRELSDDEVAYILARHMFERGEPTSLVAGKLYTHSLGFALSDVFDYEADKLLKRAPQIRVRLKAHGIRALMTGPERLFQGYTLPEVFDWDQMAPSADVSEVTGSPEEPVKVSFGCRTCTEVFSSQELRDDHERGHRKEVHMVNPQLATLTTGEQELLAAIQRYPGLYGRDYQHQIKQAIGPGELVKKGLVRGEGKTAGRRYFPVTNVPASEFPTRAGRVTTGPLREAIRKAVKINPGLTGDQLYEVIRVSRPTTSPETVVNTAQKMAIEGKLRTTGKARRRGDKALKFFPPGHPKAKAQPAPTEALTVGAVPEAKTAPTNNGTVDADLVSLKNLIADYERLQAENAELREENQTFAKIKELLG